MWDVNSWVVSCIAHVFPAAVAGSLPPPSPAKSVPGAVDLAQQGRTQAQSQGRQAVSQASHISIEPTEAASAGSRPLQSPVQGMLPLQKYSSSLSLTLDPYSRFLGAQRFRPRFIFSQLLPCYHLCSAALSSLTPLKPILEACIGAKLVSVHCDPQSQHCTDHLIEAESPKSPFQSSLHLTGLSAVPVVQDLPWLIDSKTREIISNLHNLVVINPSLQHPLREAQADCAHCSRPCCC